MPAMRPAVGDRSSMISVIGVVAAPASKADHPTTR
jgi:hypothetical protein